MKSPHLNGWRILAAFGLLILSACATTHQNPMLSLVSEADYFALVEKNTRKKQIYDGFMNVLEFSTSLLDSKLAMAQVDQNARIYQWSPEQYDSEKAKKQSELAKDTRFFLSFYVPERKHDDLNKKDSRWKIFMDVAGKRYEGRATRQKALLAEVQALYPHQSRWSTPYLVIFNVPTSVVENGTPKFTVTGPVTSAFVQF